MNQSVFEYQNYRIFLTDYFTKTKSKNPMFSYEAWARKLGLKNNTSLLKIIHGQREAGNEITEKLETYFDFTEKEKKYFRALIAFSKAKEDEEFKSYLISELIRINPKKRFNEIDAGTFALISKWYSFAIRQMTKTKNFDSSPEAISKNFKFDVSVKEIKQMIVILQNLKMLEVRNGVLKATAQSLTTSDDISVEAIKRAHEAMLENAKLALRNVDVKQRQISGLTFAIKNKDIDEAKKFIREFEDKFLAKFGANSDADEVYQLHTAFFPLTEMSKSKSGVKS